MDFRELLHHEFERRKARNPRYSLRAFARHLGTQHSSIARILNDRCRLTPDRLRALAARFGLTATEVSAACLHEQQQRVASLVARRGFRPDVRWIAMRSGLSIDEVNVAIHMLVHTRRITMTSSTTWATEHQT
jgi:transcriptional regulator with XRE-family HTH domain